MVKKVILLTDIKFNWISLAKTWRLNRYWCCNVCRSGIYNQNWFINFIKGESAYVGCHVILERTFCAKLAKATFFVDHIPTLVNNLTTKIKMLWQQRKCEECEKRICAVGSEEHKLYLDDPDFIFEHLNLDDYIFVKTLSIKIYRGVPYLYRYYDVIKIDKYRHLSIRYITHHHIWSHKIFDRDFKIKKYTEVIGHYYSFFNETAVIYLGTQRFLKIYSHFFYAVPNDIIDYKKTKDILYTSPNHIKIQEVVGWDN